MEIFFGGLRISIRNTLSSVSEETVNGIIHAIQNAGFESLLDLQLVQEKDLMFILKPIPRRKLIKAWSKPGMAEELKCEYQRMKNENFSWQTDEFLTEAKHSFDSTTNPVKVESISELLKTSICRILESVSEDTLNSIIHALNYAGLEVLLDLQFVREDDLPQVLPLFQRRKLVEAWSEQGIPFLFSSSSTVVHKPNTLCHNTHEDSSTVSSLSPSNASSSMLDLSMFTQRQAFVGSSHMNTSQPLPNLSSPYRDQTCYSLTPEPSNRVFSLASIGGESIPPVNLFKLLFKNRQLKRKKSSILLRVYAKYKTELSCPSVEEKQVVWRKIAEEVHQKFRCSKCFGHGNKCCFISGSECMDKVELLRLQYQANKNENVLSGKMLKFFNLARNAFESTENSVITVPELSSSVSLPNFKWIWKRRLALLRLYTIHKTELSSSNINKEKVWKEIAEVVGKKNPQCDENQCLSQICNMKCEYEKMKQNKPYESNQLQAVFLDEAENAFENIENPVFSVQSNLEIWAMSKPDRIKLLQVFTKYKAELSLQNFDFEKQIVWGKVAREVSKKCSSFYGKRRCCYEINHLKHLYEIAKKKNLKKIGTPYFFNEARKAFESTECTGQPKEINSSKDFVVKQERRDWYENISI